MQLQRPLLTAVALFIAVDLSLGLPILGGFQITLPHTFSAGSPARASEVNENFTAITTAVEQRASEVDARIDLLENASGIENIVTVGSSGGDFTSIAAALSSVANATAEAPALVRVGPGVYFESIVAEVPPFVTLEGSGRGATILRAERGGSVSDASAAALVLSPNATVASLTVENTGSVNRSVGIFASDASGARVVDVNVAVTQTGGSVHEAIRVTEGDLVIADSDLTAAGGFSLNLGVHARDSAGPFAQIQLSRVRVDAQGSSTGDALFGFNAAFTVRECEINGDHHAVNVNVAGLTQLIGSRLSTLGLSPTLSQNGGSSVLSATCHFVGGNAEGAATQFRYVHCYKANFAPVVNGLGSSVE